MSVAPAAGKGTIMRTGFAGQDWAQDWPTMAMATAASATTPRCMRTAGARDREDETEREFTGKSPDRGDMEAARKRGRIAVTDEPIRDASGHGPSPRGPEAAAAPSMPMTGIAERPNAAPNAMQDSGPHSRRGSGATD